MSRLLHDTGAALWGPRWQSEMAREMAVADRTVRRWAAGATPVPAGVWVDLLRLSQERAEALDGLSTRLAEAGAG